MKKFVIALCMCICILFAAGCCCSTNTGVESQNAVESQPGPMFVEIEDGDYYRVVYQKDSKVIYTISDGEKNRGIFTLIVNSDGTPMLFDSRFESNK